MATFRQPSSTNPSMKVVDATGENIKQYFLNFLETFQLNESLVNNETNINGSMINSSLPSDLVNTNSQSNAPHTSNGINLNAAGGGDRGSGRLNLSSELPSVPTSQIGSHGQGSTNSSTSYYRQQLKDMKNNGLNTLLVDFGHVFSFSDILAKAISEGYYRFEPYLRKSLSQFIDTWMPDYAYVNNSRKKREFWISFYNVSLVYRLRELTTTKIGQLLTISGTVTRTSEVRPELFQGSFQCNDCRAVVKGVEQQFKYSEPSICPNPLCNSRSWTLLMDSSIFIDWQRIRIQENSHEIPAGSMPRSMDIIIRNDMVERAKAGDKVDFTGCLIVIPDISQLSLPGSGKIESRSEGGRAQDGYNPISGSGVSGLKALGARELNYKLAFVACTVSPTESRSSPLNLGYYDDGNEEDLFSEQEKEEVLKMKSSPNLYQKLIDSMAPAIFGHTDIKAGILLMLFGGIHKVTMEGINLRGDINICIVGDPGTAKSQFLKYVTGFLPRSVFTSGKASSAAGLTASVVKDEETGEFTIEAGALMLADNGICAIDEFDKMDLADQVAIHEAMEQQTISIAKAGIQATLNARTSILAAANPLHGRYDRKKSLRQNIAMSAPIMSRFDLFFVVLDDCNEVSDYNIARHILSIHKYKNEAMDPEFSIDQIQRYIRYARTIKPLISADSAQLLVEKYVALRQNDLVGHSSSYRMTVRQLESLIRLSEALARLHLDSEVRPKYVREAYRLLKSSVIRVESDSIDLLPLMDDTDTKEDLISKSGEISNVDGPNKENDSLLSNNNNPNRMTNTRTMTDASNAKEGATNTLTMKYETYVRISNMLVYQLRRKDKGNGADDDAIGLRKSALINWYLEQIEEEIETEADLNTRTREVKAVIERLVHKDGVLIEIRDGLVDEPTLVVHPNYQP